MVKSSIIAQQGLNVTGTLFNNNGKYIGTFNTSSPVILVKVKRNKIFNITDIVKHIKGMHRSFKDREIKFTYIEDSK